MTVSWTIPISSQIRAVAENMRPVDAEECRLMSGLKPLDALQVGVEASHAVFCALADGVPVAIFGGCNGSAMAPENGMIWELGTTWIDSHPLTFARHSRRGLAMLWDSLDVDRVSNYVWVENDASRRWLYWLGASFGVKAVVSAHGGAFLPFTLERGG